MDKPENPPAFPNIGNNAWSMQPTEGMTLRDWFAGQALGGALSGILSDGSTIERSDAPTYAALAYAIADAMLAARKEPSE